MQFVKGPDFPTGAIVQGLEGLKSAYETGRGKVIVRSKYEIDKSKIEPRIIITEIPFDVNKAVLLRKMSDVIQLKGIEGIKMIRDESSRQGLRIVIDLRRDVNPDNIINFLLKQTDLQTSYNFNMVAISQGRPLQMGLVDILDAYIKHQKEVNTNRCNYDL